MEEGLQYAQRIGAYHYYRNFNLAAKNSISIEDSTQQAALFFLTFRKEYGNDHQAAKAADYEMKNYYRKLMVKKRQSSWSSSDPLMLVKIECHSIQKFELAHDVKTLLQDDQEACEAAVSLVLEENDFQVRGLPYRTSVKKAWVRKKIQKNW